ERGGETQELFAGGGQPRACLVAHENRTVEPILQNAYARAYGRLRQIQIGRGADKAAGFHDFQEGPRDVDIHTTTTFISTVIYIHLLALVSQVDSCTPPAA